MKLNKSAQTLLERYLLGVRRALSGKQRDDIRAEIESFLLDNLEERFPQSEEISEPQVMGLLHELGSPAKLAAQFSPQRYLIGPRFFPVYILVLRIVVPVVIGALTLSLVIRAFTGDLGGGAAQALDFIASLWNGALMAAAFITLVFAILERVNPDEVAKELKDFETFNPSDLPELADSDKEPKAAETIIEIVLGVLGLAFFTYLYSSGGHLPIFGAARDGLAEARFFTDNFMRFLPFMIALSGLEISRSAALLVQGRRSALTDWWHICTQVANLVMIILLLNAFPLFTLEGIINQPFAAGWDAARVELGANTGLRVVMALALVGTLIELGKQLYHQITRK